jgi:ABC-type transport system involved in cytochrome c biogenesis permease subunit
MNLPRLMPWVVATLVLAFVVSVFVRSTKDEFGPEPAVHTDGTDAKTQAPPEQADEADKAPQGMPLSEIGRLPVSDAGRTKPLDTFARNVLIKISGRQTYEVDGQKRPAIEWLLEVWANPKAAEEFRVFRIDHPDVLSLVGLSDQKRTRFSVLELRPKLDEILRQADLALKVPRKKQDPYQRHLVDLYMKLDAYGEVIALHRPYAVPPLTPGADWAPLISPEGVHNKSAAADLFFNVIRAYGTGKAENVRTELAAYDAASSESLAATHDAAGYEVIFNRCEPFYQTSVLYVLAFLLGCFALLIRPLSPGIWAPSLFRAGLFVLAIAFVIHTIGLGSRMYLQGRPPVTNLYSSAVFIGWACIPIALFGEWLTKSGLLQLIASLIGFGTLIVAHNLSGGGDTMEMMQAVLDTNFWLATHVVIVTIGYSATFLAGFLACLYVLGGVLTPLLKGEPAKALPKMIYGVICFASITSFVGTVLGGIWADQSWGRFWGWDPKENGAAMIVVWNLLILHARWGGMIKDRGVAALAIVGNIVTAWSWFGTNMLGVGLHSYGFMDSAVFWIVAFAVSQLAIMGIAFVPAHLWNSHEPDPPAPGNSPAPR